MQNADFSTGILGKQIPKSLTKKKKSELKKENTLYNIKALMGSVHKQAHNPVTLGEPTQSTPEAQGRFRKVARLQRHSTQVHRTGDS